LHSVEPVAPHVSRMSLMKPDWRLQLSLLATAITVPRLHTTRPNPREVAVDVAEVVTVDTAVDVADVVAVEPSVDVAVD